MADYDVKETLRGYKKEIRYRLNKIISRVRRIEKKYEGSTYVREKVNKDISNILGEQVSDLHVNLRNINDTKTLDKLWDKLKFLNESYTNITYVKNYSTYYERVLSPLLTLGAHDAQEVWDIYNHWLEVSKFSKENFKYDLIGKIIDYKKEGLTEEQIIQRLEVIRVAVDSKYVENVENKTDVVKHVGDNVEQYAKMFWIDLK